jgi:hypothetical protein
MARSKKLSPYGNKALSINRRSQRSLLMVGSELDAVLQERYPNNTDVQDFHINSRQSLRRPDNLGTTDLHIQCGYIRVTTGSSTWVNWSWVAVRRFSLRVRAGVP